MAAGQDDLVGAEQIGPVEVQVFVGDDVVGELFLLQPLDQVQVGGEVASAGVQPGAVLRPHVHDRPEPRRIADAAAVAVDVVERQAELRVLVEVMVFRPEFDLEVDQIRVIVLGVEPLVRVGEIGVRRGQVRDR